MSMQTPNQRIQFASDILQGIGDYPPVDVGLAIACAQVQATLAVAEAIERWAPHIQGALVELKDPNSA